MLTAIPEGSVEQIIALATIKSDGPFACPECTAEVILRKGRIKIHHFAHKPPVNCIYGVGETELHRTAKQQIYEALLASPQCRNVAIEGSINGMVRPDVRARINGEPVAIEVQGSNLGLAEIERRTRHYYELGVFVLWVQPGDPSDDRERAAPAAWEKWVHSLYFGRLHYWDGGEQLLPVHFGEYQISIPESEWYEEGGVHRQEGGYDRRSKRWRTVSHGEYCSITDGFALQRTSWKEVPSAKIWQSTQDNWWSSKITKRA